MPSSEESSRPPFDYTLREWMDHYEFRAERSQVVAPTTLRQEIESVFRRRYPNVAERRYKRRRFVAGMTYLDSHMSDFDLEDFAVEGSAESGDLVSKHLIFAVYMVYCQVPDDRIHEDFPPALVLKIARDSKA